MKYQPPGETSSDTLNQFEATFVGVAPISSKGGDSKQLILKVSHGKKGSENFSFPQGKDVTLGRLERADICLSHHSVSRTHSKITWKEGRPWILDLGSTNGTFVNKKKIQESILHDGDSLKIGLVAVKVQLESGAIEEGTQTRISRILSHTQEILKKVAFSRADSQTILSGSLGRVNLPEILQTVVATQGEGILVVRGPQLGKIYIRERNIFFARTEKQKGRKALYRMFSWKQGRFDFRPLEDELLAELDAEKLPTLPQDFPGDMTHTVLEYFRIYDEFQQIAARVPKNSDLLKHNPRKILPKEKGLKRLQEIYDQIALTPRVGDLLDVIPLIDMDIYRVLTFFLDRHYLQFRGAK